MLKKLLPSPEADKVNKGNKHSENKRKYEKKALRVPRGKIEKLMRHRGAEKKTSDECKKNMIGYRPKNLKKSKCPECRHKINTEDRQDSRREGLVEAVDDQTAKQGED